MRLPRYELQATTDRLQFKFTSVGPKGDIEKVIEFSYIGDLNVWNLGFGDLDPVTNCIDNQTVSNNDDGRKVLATVAYAVQEFFSLRPDATVFFTGSTDQRTRVCGWALSVYWDELSTRFEINLLTADGDTVLFSRSVSALGYLIKLH